MCTLEEFGVFPGLLHTASERCIDWHDTSSKTLESKGDRINRRLLAASFLAVFSSVGPHRTYTHVTGDGFRWGEEKNLSNILSPA